MEKKEFQNLLSDVHNALVQLTATKGEEYARSNDQLANFYRSATEAGIDPRQVWLVFFNKHADAIKHYIHRQQGMKPSEPIEERIMDAILYLILLLALERDRKGNNKSSGRIVPSGPGVPGWDAK